MTTRRHVALLFGLVAAASCDRGPRSAPAAPAVEPSRRRTEIELSPEGLRNAQVRTTRVTLESFAPRLTMTGSIEADPRSIAHVGARVPGRVVAISVTLGERVREGQALVEIDTVELHQVSKEYLTAVARSREANDAVARQRQLVAERVGAVADLRRAEADAAAASATLHEGEEHLHFLGLSDQDIRRLRIRSSHGEAHSVVRAPIAGRVAALGVTLGRVLTGVEEIVTITRLDDVWATLRVYERDLAGVTPGVTVEVRVPSYPERAFVGTVTFVGDLVDPVTRTLEVRAALANADGALRPGMTVVASAVLRGARAQLWIPEESVQAHDAGRVVFVQIAPRRFAARPVSVGEARDGLVPVTAGLSPGDEIVVGGAFALRGEIERAELEAE